MSQLTDFLMIGMMGVGGLMIFFNWDMVKNCISDIEGCLGGGGGTSGNCTYDLSKSQFTWTGNHTICQAGKTMIINDAKTINCAQSDGVTKCTKEDGCGRARSSWLTSFTNKPCVGGSICNGLKCTAPAKLNTSTCKCVSPTTGNCFGGFIPCTGGCCCNRDIKKCGSGQITVVVGTGANATCKCYSCNQGFHRVNNTCVVNTGGNVTACGAQANGAQAWIARTAVAILGRMCNCGNVDITQIMQGWPSLSQQCALDNQCNSNKLHVSYPTFNKHYAQLLLAVANARSIPLTVLARGALNTQNATGVWQLAQWDSNIVGYRAHVDMKTGYGKAYSATLVGRENMWDPYGNQKYSFTLPKEGMKVKVSN